MSKLFTLFTRMDLLFIAIVLMTMLQLSQTKISDSRPETDMSADDIQDDSEEGRRASDLNRLRHFLLTSNAEQRAAKREQQEFYKRELIREYLQSISDPNPERFQEVKKRFKTYCNSYEDLMHSNWATCG